MDEQRFDQLSRRFASMRTRRQAVKALAGAVVATVAGTKATAVQAATAIPCTAHYSPCGGDGECCAGAVCEHGLCMPGCRVDGAFIHALISPPENICGQCQPSVSTTSLVPVNEGMACWSGNPNAGMTTCQQGVCTGQAPRSCPPPTPCHLEGEVDPATGLCVNPPAPAGTPCGNGPICAGGFYQPADTCDGNGFCIGGGSQSEYCPPIDDCTPPCNEGGCAQTSACTGFDTCIDGTCTCIRDCAGKTCGDDGCGGSCGNCGLLEVCHEGSCCFRDRNPCDRSCGGSEDGGCGFTVTCPRVTCGPNQYCKLGRCADISNL